MTVWNREMPKEPGYYFVIWAESQDVNIIFLSSHPTHPVETHGSKCIWRVDQIAWWSPRIEVPRWPKVPLEI